MPFNADALLYKSDSCRDSSHEQHHHHYHLISEAAPVLAIAFKK